MPLDSLEHAESAPSAPSAAAPARNPRRVKESIRRVNSPVHISCRLQGGIGRKRGHRRVEGFGRFDHRHEKAQLHLMFRALAGA